MNVHVHVSYYYDTAEANDVALVAWDTGLNRQIIHSQT